MGVYVCEVPEVPEMRVRSGETVQSQAVGGAEGSKIMSNEW